MRLPGVGYQIPKGIFRLVFAESVIVKRLNPIGKIDFSPLVVIIAKKNRNMVDNFI